jgi:threonyl-tRNA synthetase
MYALLEKAHMDSKQGKAAALPLWLAPVQVRLCPLSDEYIKDCIEFASALKDVRVDIDDRAETVQRKVRDAELEWVPIILVVGSRERETKVFNARLRETGKMESMPINELSEYVKKRTEGRPSRPIGLPIMLSTRPSFCT